MRLLPSEVDKALGDFVELGQRANRRRQPRRVYDGVIYAAPYDGASFPLASQFRRVDGKDFSFSGIAFYQSEPLPKGDRLVLLLNAGKAPVFLTARVVRTVSESKRHLIGCQFTGTLASANE